MEGFAALFIALAASTITTFLSTIFLICVERSRGLLCKDMHKPYEYYVPCIGGIPIYIGLSMGITILYICGFIEFHVYAVTILSTLIALVIGFLDDTLGLSPLWKVFLGLIPALPVVIFRCYTPRPWVPFLGHTRLYIIYPLLIFAASTVFINGSNMVDTHNGVLPTYALSAITFALMLKVVSNSPITELSIGFLLVATISTYLLFNMYPAKIFNGNTGSFLIGAILMLTTVLLEVEFYMIVASIPMLLNGFYYISSVKGLLQKEKVNRPTYLDKNGCIYPGKGVHPITFIKMVLKIGGRPLSEKELVKVLSLVYLTTSFLSFIICALLGYH